MTRRCDTCKLKEVTEIAKKGIDAYEFCIQGLEKELEPFQDDYFQGLTKQQIAELAKKSIKITADNCKLTHALEEIREAVKTNLDAGILISGGWIEQKIDEVLNPHN